MARSLQRIQRIRHLAEEQARLELERETQRLRQAQSARIDIAAQVHHQRVQLAASFPQESEVENITTENNQAQDWLLAGAALEFSSWNQMQLEQWCIQEAERVAPLAERFQERRKELRQIDKLVESQLAEERLAQERRDQAEADSWFQIETARQKRNQRGSDFDPSLDTKKK